MNDVENDTMTAAETWLYSIEQNLTGEENMRRDEEMARACVEDAVPRLRFYSWNPWTLSLGYNQSDARIDKEELKRKGYDLVRRPTGGAQFFTQKKLRTGLPCLPEGAGSTRRMRW